VHAEGAAVADDFAVVAIELVEVDAAVAIAVETAEALELAHGADGVVECGRGLEQVEAAVAIVVAGSEQLAALVGRVGVGGDVFDLLQLAIVAGDDEHRLRLGLRQQRRQQEHQVEEDQAHADGGPFGDRGAEG
jgi:hypothetical protein